MNQGSLLADKLPVNGLSVGAVAALLGIAPGTLRSWGRRYGLVPAGRSVGGHRRYTESETLTLIRMQTLVNAGEAPSTAASMVRSTQDLQQSCETGTDVTVARVNAAFDRGHPPGRRPGARRPTGGPDGLALAASGATAQVRDLARAAGELDIAAVGRIVEHHLMNTGALPTWEELLRPVLVAAASACARTGGTDIVHVLNEAIMDALRVHRARQLRPRASGPVLLAGSVEEMHVLPLYVLGAALAERRVPAVLLGAHVPSAALASAVRRTGASAVFLWRGREYTDEIDLRQLPPLRPRVRVVVGGPGWHHMMLPTDAHRASSLQEATSILQSGVGVEKTCASGRGTELGLQRRPRAAVPISALPTLECGG